jgi:leucyl aminopeptidase
VLDWRGGEAGVAPLAFVGKGVTFDTGGISLKPGAGMEDMKWDMGGAGAVSGAMLTIARRKAKLNVVGILGLVENMPDGNAQRPGDVVTSMSGQTIEVINTDAEGRLVLCDALTFVQREYKPAKIIDLATLTGAIIMSLAHEYAGLFSNDDALAADLTKVGLATGDKLWRMPMGAVYDKMIDSPIADMKNVGSRFGGSITAAQFLPGISTRARLGRISTSPVRCGPTRRARPGKRARPAWRAPARRLGA